MTREDGAPSPAQAPQPGDPSDAELTIVEALMEHAGLRPDRQELMALRASCLAMSAWCAELYDGLEPLAASGVAQ